MACRPGQPTVSQRLWFSFILKRRSWREGRVAGAAGPSTLAVARCGDACRRRIRRRSLPAPRFARILIGEMGRFDHFNHYNPHKFSIGMLLCALFRGGWGRGCGRRGDDAGVGLLLEPGDCLHRGIAPRSPAVRSR